MGGLIALVVWAPNLAWQFVNGWPQLTMASALHEQNTSRADYLAAVPGQLVYAGLLGIPLVVAGLIRLWRSAELRFLGVTASIILASALVWIPGKVYYVDGILPAILANGAVSAAQWIARARRSQVRQTVLGILAVVGTVAILPAVLPVLPVLPLAKLRMIGGATSIADSVGWPQLADDVATQNAALTRAGRPPTSIFTGSYAEAGALKLYDAKHHLPPIISGHNMFWMWGPGGASDETVLYVDAADQLTPLFASCHRLSVYNPPYQVRNDWNDLPIGVCTGPSGPWKALWPRLKHYN